MNKNIFIVTTGCFTAMFFVVLGSTLEKSPGKQIQEFKNPTCIERDIGRETIKKCYIIIEQKGVDE